MGLSHSKAHSRVIKVAPVPSKEEETAGPVDFTLNPRLEERNLCLLPRIQDRSEAWGGPLPPLRETWYGRYSTVSRAMYFDIPLEKGETSIIKRHPPRRPQKLEPIDLPQVIASERFLSQREARTRHKAKQELEKKMQAPVHTSGKRQYLHKMQMLEMNRKRQEAQMQFKKSLHREARINDQKLRDHEAEKILPSVSRSDDDGLLATSGQMDRCLGNLENAEVLEHHAGSDYCTQKIGKMEAWIREQEARGQLLWDSSSSDTDELGNDEKKPRALVRTRTERIPHFDEFFDQG
ncbi:uncharacterized protein CCDC198 [Ochotona curzoniae]|uniref:uncharacterized protein CCDC198 n=1 Tax=Ochotona curzoniae TaxID=130825 RepID=UPI001B353DF4|nr:uncharacterized protein CCDC198 [Ochotona curzoniae]